MDWSGYDNVFIINTTYGNEENNFKIKYDIMKESHHPNDFELKLETSTQIIKYIITRNVFPLVYDIQKYILRDFKNMQKVSKLQIIKKGNILFINDNILIPLLIEEKRKFYEIYDLCMSINIQNYKNILIYHETYPILENICIKYFNKNPAKYSDKSTLKENNYDLFFVDYYTKYNDNECDWLYHKIDWYIKILPAIAKYCSYYAKCIIEFDMRFFNIHIYSQIIRLYSCFMNISVSVSFLSNYPKCFVIGTNINIIKLKSWIVGQNIENIQPYKNSYIYNNNICTNIEKIITDIGINIPDDFNKNIKNIYYKYNKYSEERFKIANNPNISIKYLLKKSIRYMYEYLINKRIPFELNPYYLDKPDKIVFKVKKINNTYFPDILNVNFSKLKLTPSALYSVSYPKEANRITDIIIDIVGNNNKIVDCCANCGGNTISFAQKFKKVISIELEKHNYIALQNNIKQYKFDNVKTYNTDCLEYLKKHNYKRKVLFFDPPWGGELISVEKANNVVFDSNKIHYINTNTNIDIRLSGQHIDDIIEYILKQNKKVKIFMKAPNQFNSKLDHKMYKIKNYKLLYFNIS